MLGQRPTHRLLARRLIGGRHLTRSLSLVGLQVFQLQLQLLDLMVQFFRLAAKLHAPQFGNLEFELLDFERAYAECLLQCRDRIAQLLEFTVTLQEQRFQGIKVVR